MNIGIYNRYWSTCGGGENYTGSIAEILSQEHDVTLISIEDVDWSKIEDRLRLDLSRCKKTQWPALSCDELSPRSAEFELFINSTYSSSMRPYSLKSALICYFPHKVKGWRGVRSAISRIRSLASKFSAIGDSVVALSGTYEVEVDGRCWLGRSSLISVRLDKNAEARIPLWPGAYCGIYRVAIGSKECEWELRDGAIWLSAPECTTRRVLVSISCNAWVPASDGGSTDTRPLGACVDVRRLSWKQGSITGKEADALAAYDRVISISQYTTRWIRSRWGLPCIELYPPIDTQTFTFEKSHSREKIILSVGRFFAGGHNKKHHEMARAFIRMRAEGVISDDWRLVLVGARHIEHSNHLKYFEELQNIAHGHPIDILPNRPFSELLDLYRRASIYWHAAGWGESETAHPERLEHFGITTCEAMACGCVPIVYHGAGQREIVREGQTGHFFKDYQSLAANLRRLTKAHDDGGLAGMRERARNDIERYSRATFRSRVWQSMDGLIVSSSSPVANDPILERVQ